MNIIGNSIAIIIDCASDKYVEKHNNTQYNQMIQNITMRIDAISNLESVVLSTYNTNEHLDHKTKFYKRIL